MNKRIAYVHGETGIELIVIADFGRSGDIELKEVIHCGEDILSLLGEDMIIDIEMFCEDYISSTLE